MPGFRARGRREQEPPEPERALGQLVVPARAAWASVSGRAEARASESAPESA